MGVRDFIRRHKVAVGTALVVGTVLGVFLLYWFQPWKLFTNRVANEPFPGAPVATAPTVTPSAEPTPQPSLSTPTAPSPAPAPSPSPSPTPVGPVTVASGEFRGIDHHTEGTALLIQLEDGSYVLRFEGFETSDGPDVRIYLSAAPADAAEGDHDDDFIDLGAMTANIGDQNYAIPAGTDIDRFQSAVVWCRRFSTGFGVAPLA